MYQSFPKNSYTEKSSSAMPIPQMVTESIEVEKQPLPPPSLPAPQKLNFLNNMKMDDLIIIGLIILLLTEEDDHWLLIGLLAFLLIG